MIDELDVFNAQVTLALAHVTRHRALFGPMLVSEVAPLVATLPDQRSTTSVEPAAAHAVFGLHHSPGKVRHSLFNAYCLYWQTFVHRGAAAAVRVVVNAPHAGSVVHTPGTTRVNACYDRRIQVGVTPLPDGWAMPAGHDPYVDDLVLFSEDGLDAVTATRLVMMVGDGTTVTLLRPGDRCAWFARCGVRHDFGGFLERLSQRVNLERIFTSDPGAPVMTTIFGARSLNLTPGRVSS